MVQRTGNTLQTPTGDGMSSLVSITANDQYVSTMTRTCVHFLIKEFKIAAKVRLLFKEANIFFKTPRIFENHFNQFFCWFWIEY